MQESNITPKQPQRSPYISYITMIGSCIAWVSGYVYCNQHNIGPIQLSMARSILLILTSYGICKYKKRPMHLHILSSKSMLIRNSLFIGQGLIIAVSQFYLPLYAVHTVANVGPVWVIILDYLIDGKKLSKQRIIWLIIALIGIFIIGNRELIMEYITGQKVENVTEFQNYKSDNPIVLSFICLMLIVMMFFWAYAIKITQKIACSAEEINLSFGFILSVVTSIIYFYLPEKTPSEIMYPAYLWTGVILALAQILFVTAITTSVQVGITIVIGNFTIIVAYALSVFRYSEPISILCVISSAISILAISKIIFN